MTTEKIYGPPIKWNGGECPVPPETMVKIKLRSGHVTGPVFAVNCVWERHNHHTDIVEYCVTASEIDAAEQMLRANGYTITPPAKPLTFEDVVPLTDVPEKGTRYWMLSAVEPEGILCVKSFNDWFDQRAIKRRVAYPDKEQALVAARRIFGLKGGEL